MKRICSFVFGLCLLGMSTAQAQSLSPSTKWHWNEGQIVVDTPTLPAGQQTAVGLTRDKMDCVRIGFAGLGMRGQSAVDRMCFVYGTQTVALCDYDEARAGESQK